MKQREIYYIIKSGFTIHKRDMLQIIRYWNLLVVDDVIILSIHYLPISYLNSKSFTCILPGSIPGFSWHWFNFTGIYSYFVNFMTVFDLKSAAHVWSGQKKQLMISVNISHFPLKYVGRTGTDTGYGNFNLCLSVCVCLFILLKNN